MNILAERVEPLAIDVSFSEVALHVVLADGREISAPLQWFPRLLRATQDQRAQWELTVHANLKTSRERPPTSDLSMSSLLMHSLVWSHASKE
ncbi:MAG: DUF2442 domain-containing protein [Gammaproteobacteria bacterium]